MLNDFVFRKCETLNDEDVRAQQGESLRGYSREHPLWYAGVKNAMGKSGSASSVHDGEETAFRTKRDCSVQFTESVVMAGNVITF